MAASQIPPLALRSRTNFTNSSTSSYLFHHPLYPTSSASIPSILHPPSSSFIPFLVLLPPLSSSARMPWRLPAPGPPTGFPAHPAAARKSQIQRQPSMKAYMSAPIYPPHSPITKPLASTKEWHFSACRTRTFIGCRSTTRKNTAPTRAYKLYLIHIGRRRSELPFRPLQLRKPDLLFGLKPELLLLVLLL